MDYCQSVHESCANWNKRSNHPFPGDRWVEKKSCCSSINMATQRFRSQKMLWSDRAGQEYTDSRSPRGWSLSYHLPLFDTEKPHGSVKVLIEYSFLIKEIHETTISLESTIVNTNFETMVIADEVRRKCYHIINVQRNSDRYQLLKTKRLCNGYHPSGHMKTTKRRSRCISTGMGHGS